MSKPRLFVEPMNIQNGTIEITGDAHHYLSRVMRLKAGDEFAVFDGSSDSLNAKIQETNKRETIAEIIGTERTHLTPPNLELAFAPIKKARTDFIVEKAAELGVRSIQPIQTAYTNSERINPDRLKRHAIEAVEQCGGTYIPELQNWQKLENYLSITSRQLLFCDEAAEAGLGLEEFEYKQADSWAILIGPEGGFSPEERELILKRGAIRLSLGPRILRADTAAIAAITLWQKTHGDW